MNFLDWLMKQTGRNDDIGSFASDVRYHREISFFPTGLEGDTTKKHWTEYLNSKGFNPSDKTLTALDDAWDEFTSDDPFANTPTEGQSALDL